MVYARCSYLESFAAGCPLVIVMEVTKEERKEAREERSWKKSEGWV